MLSLHVQQEQIAHLAVNIGMHHTSLWTPQPWVLVISSLSLPRDFQESIVLPLRAISYAFQYLRYKNAGLRHDAFRNYFLGLQKQRGNIKQLLYNRHQSGEDIVLQNLLMALSLLEFEMMAPLAPDSWLRHVPGCLELLRQAGTESCRKPPFFEIFKHLRFLLVR